MLRALMVAVVMAWVVLLRALGHPGETFPELQPRVGARGGRAASLRFPVEQSPCNEGGRGS